MYKIIYMGGYNPRIFEQILAFNNIELSGVIIDYTLPKDNIEETKEIMRKNNIKELVFDEIPTISPDIVFLCNYTKILESELIDNYLFVNIHAGILPKWRGFNANCWAMLNGESKIGYTIHRVREGLDAGEIYKIIDISLSENETYSTGRERIKNLLCDNLEEIFEGIISKTLSPKVQQEKEIVYNCKLRKSDGDITDWNKPSTWLINLKRVFGCPPDGTGVRMLVKGKVYTIVDMEIANEIGNSQGIPGAVINKYADGSALIKTSDTAVRIKMLMDENEIAVLPSSILKIGMRL